MTVPAAADFEQRYDGLQPEPDSLVADGRRMAVHRPLGVAEAARAGVRTGVPVLLIHGLSGTGMQWDPLVRYLPADRPVLAPDLPGFGGSEVTGGLTASAVAGTLAALVLEELDRPVDVIGHEWGATLAIALSALRPELVRRLVVISGAWPPSLAAGPGEPPPGMKRSQRLTQGPLAAASRQIAAGYLALDGELAGQPRPERSLVVWGTHDRRLRPRYGEKVVTVLGRCVDPATVEMVTVPGAASAPHLSAAEIVGPLLCDFLRAP